MTGTEPLNSGSPPGPLASVACSIGAVTISLPPAGLVQDKRAADHGVRLDFSGYPGRSVNSGGRRVIDCQFARWGLQSRTRQIVLDL
jgi:hypothetical protein